MDNSLNYVDILKTTLQSATIHLATPEDQLRPWGLGEGDFTLPDDFNAPLPEDILTLFEPK